MFKYHNPYKNWLCLANKLLGPNILSVCVFGNADTDLCERSIQNVFAVSFGVHPACHDLLRRNLA